MLVLFFHFHFHINQENASPVHIIDEVRRDYPLKDIERKRNMCPILHLKKTWFVP